MFYILIIIRVNKEKVFEETNIQKLFISRFLTENNILKRNIKNNQNDCNGTMITAMVLNSFQNKIRNLKILIMYISFSG